jgi:hypothetical protein
MRGKFLLVFTLLLVFIGAAASSQAQTLKPAVRALPPQARQAFYQTTFEQRAAQLYAKLGLAASGLPLSVFREGLVGYYNVRQQGGGRPLLTLIDFARSSQAKRLWVINVAQGKVLFNTLVAHGKATGEDLALAFSNKGGSEMSSLGFYRTAPGTYNGKHGTSLKIFGLDPGFNTNAANRAVVVHGAEYVCEDFVKKHGRLGRSQGCPALPVAETEGIITAIKGGSVLYLHGPPQAGYRSKWLDEANAVQAFAQQEGLAVLAGPSAAN